MNEFVLPLREAATIAVLAAVIVVLVARMRRGTRVMRFTLVPVLAVSPAARR